MKSPAVDRKVVRLLAGMVWTAVGLALCAVSVYWLTNTDGNWIVPLVIGIIVGIAVYYFGFSRLVIKNRTRIEKQSPGKDKICLFAFQSWRNYIIVVVMMAMGYTLRHLGISRNYLVPVYMAIGVGLFLSSLLYYSTD